MSISSTVVQLTAKLEYDNIIQAGEMNIYSFTLIEILDIPMSVATLSAESTLFVSA